MNPSSENLNETNSSSKLTSCNSRDSTYEFSVREPQKKGPITIRRNYILKTEFFQRAKITVLKPLKSHSSQEVTYSENSPIYSYFFYNEQENNKKKNQEEASVFSDFVGVLTDTTEVAENRAQPIENNNIDDEGLALFIQTHQGCLKYQNLIQKDHKFANEVLYPHLKPYMLQLIVNEYGNYLYEDFLYVLNYTNFIHYINFISINFESIIYSPFGSKIVQSLLSRANLEEKIGTEIVKSVSEAMKGRVAKIAINEYASHIIKKFIKMIQSPYNDFIFQELYKSFTQISTTKFGCCVIDYRLMHSDYSQKKNLINLIINNSTLLITNQFGNYIYQNLIMNSSDELILKIYSIISEDIFFLSKGKYSSNVIEKFFEIKNKALINEIAKCMLHYDSKIIDLVRNNYGNYIIQKIITSITDQHLTKKILSIIIKNIERVVATACGQKLLYKLAKIYPFISFRSYI